MDRNNYFDKIAPQWDRMRSQFFSPAVRDKAFRLAGVEPGRLAGDIGAGTGFLTEGLLSRDVRVIAVDQSQKMLDQIQHRFGESDHIDCRVGTAERLPIDDEMLDYVFANMYLHHVEDPAHAIREMTRVLKPGGVLVVTDLDEHSHEFLRTEHNDRWMGFDRDDVRSWLQQASLRSVDVESIGEECGATSSEGEEAAISIFVALGRKNSLAA